MMTEVILIILLLLPLLGIWLIIVWAWTNEIEKSNRDDHEDDETLKRL